MSIPSYLYISLLSIIFYIMSRTLRTKQITRAKMSRLHHKIGKTDNISSLGPFEKPQIPKSIMPFLQNQSLNFSGTAKQLKQKFDCLTPNQKSSVNKITLSINGDKIQEENTKCIYLTFFFAAICIFPILLLFTDWFRKNFRRIFSLQISTYQLIAYIINQCLNTSQAHIFIQDNFVDKIKLKKILEVKNVVDIVLVNVAEKTSFDEEGFHVFKNFFQNYQSALNIQALWGSQKIKVSSIKTNEFSICDIN